MAYDLIMDVRAPRNRVVLFAPAHVKLRGDILVGEISSDKIPGILNQVGGFIPGQQVHVDVKAQKVKFIDRMNLPEFQEKDRQIREALARQEISQSFTHYQPDQELSVEDEEWPTWLYHLRRTVDHGRFHIIKGELASMKAIRKLGVIKLGDDGGAQPREGRKPFNFLYPEDEKPVAAKV